METLLYHNKPERFYTKSNCKIMIPVCYLKTNTAIENILSYYHFVNTIHIE